MSIKEIELGKAHGFKGLKIAEFVCFFDKPFA
jgi:hypothetical protein